MLCDDLIRGAKAAARHTGLSERTIYTLAEAKQIPSMKKGGVLFFRKSELDEAFRSVA